MFIKNVQRNVVTITKNENNLLLRNGFKLKNAYLIINDAIDIENVQILVLKITNASGNDINGYNYPQPDWEREEGTTPKTYRKVSKNFLLVHLLIFFRQCFMFFSLLIRSSYVRKPPLI